MGQFILYAVLFSCMAGALVRPWIGVVVSYFIVILNPQNIWWWNFEGMRPVYWILVPTLIGFGHGVLTGKYDTNKIKSKINLYLAVLWCMFTLSYYFGPYVEVFSQYRFYDASYVFEIVNKIFLLYFVASFCIDEEMKLKVLIGVLLLSVCYLTYWANDQYLAGKQFGRIMGPSGVHGTGIYADENGFALLFVVGAPFFYYLGFYFRRIGLRCICWLAIPFAWHAIFLTGSRGGLLGLCTTIVLAGLRSPKKKLGVCLIPVFVFAYIWQAGDMMKDRTNTITDYEAESSAQTRIEAWNAAKNMIFRYPFIGAGFASFGPAFPDHSEKRPREAHNTVLQISAESGIVAGAMYVFIVIACIGSLLKNGRRLMKDLNPREPQFLYLMNEAALVSFSGFAVCSMFLSLQTYEIFYFLCLVVNTVFCLSRKGVLSESNPGIVGSVMGNLNNCAKLNADCGKI